MPFITACSPLTSPAVSGSSNSSTAESAPLPVRPGATARITAATITAAPVSRVGVMRLRPAGPMPHRSTPMPPRVCPATNAIVNNATPVTPATTPWVTTKYAASSPASMVDHGNARLRTAAGIWANARLAVGTISTSRLAKTSPTKEVSQAASMPSSSRTPRVPVIRACTGRSVPISTAIPMQTAVAADECPVTRAAGKTVGASRMSLLPFTIFPPRHVVRWDPPKSVGIQQKYASLWER